MDLLGEFSIDLELETRALAVEAKALCSEYKPTSVVSVGAVRQVTCEGPVDDLSCSDGSSKNCPVPYAQMALAPSRLLEIPLPYFDGECQNWPAFRDRFRALVDQRANIPNIDKFYYFIGCLHAGVKW